MSVSRILLQSGWFIFVCVCRCAVNKILCFVSVHVNFFYVRGCVFIRILLSILLPAIEIENGEKYTVLFLSVVGL